MAQVLIRNLDESVVKKLRARAKANGRSLEAELRLVLEAEATSARRVSEASTPYRSPEDDTHYEDPNYPGIRFPKKPYVYKPFKPIKVKPGAKLASEQLIEERR